jgi:hypothetical protein
MSRPIFKTDPGAGVGLVRRWMSAPGLRELVEADGGEWPRGNLTEVVDRVEEFSSVWDRRAGRSRLVFKEADESRTDRRAVRTYAAAGELGLLDPSPPVTTDVDHVLVLGGLATGVEPRVRYVAELLDTNQVRTRRVVGLGSFRALHDREQVAAQRYAPGARSEIDLLTAMMTSAFPRRAGWRDAITGDHATDPHRAEQDRRRPGRPDLTAYAARSSDPGTRPANTADTYRQFARDADLRAGQAILIVTSAIYLPFQHLDAVQAFAGYGVTVESVGVPTRSAAPTHPPSAYLQEIRSTVRSAQRVLRAGLVA